MLAIQKIIDEIKGKSIMKNHVQSNPILKETNLPLKIEDFNKVFKDFFKKNFKRDFEFTIESKNYYYTLLHYFYGMEDFYKSTCLIHGSNNPSLVKGLLIIGNPGVGKSAVLKSFEYIFREFCVFNPNYNLKIIPANEAVSEYETLENALAKLDFSAKMSKGFKCFDDVKSEREASNFGKVNVIKDILFTRYNNNKRTIITCNYDENFPNDYQKAMDEFGTKYDGRIYDRLFEMFNIIIVGGKSFRK